MTDGPDPQLVTFGCRLNGYESEVMREHARAAGLDHAVIVNTCAVTKEAERQARQAIRKLRRENPGIRLIVTGCAAQLDPARFAAMPEVDRVLGNDEKLRPESYRDDAAPLLVDDIMQARETAGHLITGFETRTRAFVQVQQGCDHRCTFCIIPFARGPNRSVPLGRVVEQVRTLVEGGTQEVVLTGVDITSYGADLPGRPTLGETVARLLALVPDLPRLRLSSLDPVGVDETLLRLVAEEPRLLPHLHLSVQAGDDLILKRMKRRHLRHHVVDLAARLRDLRPGLALGADLIAGFPTETEAHAANTLALVDEADLTHLHVFPYSARPGTPAARMPPVPGDVARARAAALREAGERRLAGRLAARVGGVADVLLETPGVGHTEDYLPVDVGDADGVAPGTVVRVRLTGTDGLRLTGCTKERMSA
ncbi:tRNA (N(6)-L-threonylcarbamoyladenosine(37)-C(2))-methylthiotransferase MtaB [Roseospira marina]|uniref:tRNA (N(6)-L-threonylcarbamoyladenosine(37)-C(2))-methylthiotransferase MtaB n=1 Tax=Roseospira marina TaxID=140057 RepID=A0A5M6ICP7_9PROT|nr:tRNA (N(6)-L-threonylcarbamoyladenosine(37)-C(2))-methylthiotransferase MtaB [Roseospira marina]KAA5605973.1 tRNA (N(6)-L-threonylcarbamoyladenosine(37)-C(2))-methylthiotransferase MtaB [Roseospira marina]MBB4313178.1 threonylcarbamoyladenosine tRNA methylthiotransferase MtaB [Roseospira marina]MBB5086081.1 threonylcarbamoyladenosine tRNA methylthiotransferase MtaB [Roseospira marina]